MVRAIRRRRFFASRAKESEHTIYKENDAQDYLLSPFAEKPKLRLSPPTPGTPIDEKEGGLGSAMEFGEQETRRCDLGRDSPV